ncbi:MAG TPA: helix-turn-helix transcriptional regulator [Candidatus Angelobacter sp.]
MTAWEFKKARKDRKWTQHELAKRLKVSQTYVALLERGERQFPSYLVRMAVRVLKMSPAALPVTKNPFSLSADCLAYQLGALGYPGFSHLRSVRKRNPAEVMLSALAQDNLEARVAEALPWVLLQYSNMSDATKKWLLNEVRLGSITNRLGFVVTLAKEVAEGSGDTTSQRYQSLVKLEEELLKSRLDKEDTLCQSSMSSNEREWLKQVRPPEAKNWHLLTDWRPEHLPYAS